jgi:hypothetical protein
MKNAVFWDVAPYTSCVNRRFGGTYCLHLQGRKSASGEPAWAGGCRLSASWKQPDSLQPPAHAGSSLVDFSTLKMEAIRYSETSVHTISTRRHIPEYGNLQDRVSSPPLLVPAIQLQEEFPSVYIGHAHLPWSSVILATVNICSSGCLQISTSHESIIKLTLIIILEYHCYQYHIKLYPMFFSQG